MNTISEHAENIKPHTETDLARLKGQKLRATKITRGSDLLQKVGHARALTI